MEEKFSGLKTTYLQMRKSMGWNGMQIKSLKCKQFPNSLFIFYKFWCFSPTYFIFDPLSTITRSHNPQNDTILQKKFFKLHGVTLIPHNIVTSIYNIISKLNSIIYITNWQPSKPFGLLRLVTPSCRYDKIKPGCDPIMP